MIAAAAPDSQVDDDLDAALQTAAEEGRAEEIANLLGAGANVNGRNTLGATALHLATEFNGVGAMKALVDGGAELDAPNTDGWTPLMDAAFCGSILAMEFLLEAGADWRLEARDEGGDVETALSLATGKAQEVLAAWVADHETPQAEPEPVSYE